MVFCALKVTENSPEGSPVTRTGSVQVLRELRACEGEIRAGALDEVVQRPNGASVIVASGREVGQLGLCGCDKVSPRLEGCGDRLAILHLVRIQKVLDVSALTESDGA